MAERQRRKAARESTSAAAAGQTSLVGDVTRRASMLWPGRKSIQNSRPGLGNHTKLKSQESLDVLPLGSMNGSPGASAATSPAASATSILETPTADKNPFEHPADPVSPFADSHRSPEQDSTLMNESSLPSTPVAKRASGSKRSPDRPVLEATTSYTNPPPPLPLGLPPPRSPPPPRADDVPVDRPPEPTVRPTLAQANTSDVDDGKETRWWHDWLCGCGEGPDRGGESQAGRTNPLE
ncbi:hypothetical protein PLICRDRAFT_36882 [Plicaturopsis crispa FD-325 SS-3]|nr:hypothetical protein PLICRDRAFT_36882 [Plicaturopsis crispa FD-325 SS-3]